MRTRAAIIFCYDDFRSLAAILPVILKSKLDRIIFAVETCPEAARLIESIEDRRVTLFYSSRRLGKASAFNRCIRNVEEDLVYLISCDVMFDSTLIDTLDAFIDSKHCGAITSVNSRSHSGIIGEASRILWHIRDIELEYFQQLDRPVHGGEFVAIRREFLQPIPQVVNEDEYICLEAQKTGHMIRYVPTLEVYNSVPKTFSDYVTQRRRVIFGHLQMREFGFRPYTMNFRIWEDFMEFSRIIFRLIRKYPQDVLTIHLTIIMEIISHLFARKDLKTKMKHVLWKVAKSAKF